MNGRESNIIRNIFRNELTWLGTIVVAVWTAVTQIILPINTIQAQLAQVQSDMSDIKKSALETNTAISSNSNRITALETRDESYDSLLGKLAIYLK